MSVKSARINGAASIVATHPETEQETAAYTLYREAAYVLCQVRGANPDDELKIEVPSRLTTNVKQFETIARWKTLIPEIMNADHILLALSVTRNSRMPVYDPAVNVRCPQCGCTLIWKDDKGVLCACGECKWSGAPHQLAHPDDTNGGAWVDLRGKQEQPA